MMMMMMMMMVKMMMMAMMKMMMAMMMRMMIMMVLMVSNNRGQLDRVVSASDSRSGGRGFDSGPCHVAVALGKQFTLTFPSPPTCKMGTQLQAILEFVICACNTLHMGLKLPLMYWFAGALVALLLWRHSYAE
ncbi:hypothetical protein ElyMa_003099700 [Elysia marginata]|uniref:Uncharacterized protein n=1 Tax=Elysia marginata TaxID=1093978 RepID=A0AAV4IMS5_9GAST|nr:hypothetical protein ElyMa_003099700 [Elysia marginata]